MVLYPRDDVDKLYVSRKEGERGLISIDDSVDASIKQLENYIEKRGERNNRKVRHQKQFWQHKDKQNGNNQKRKMGRKTTLWMF